MAKEDIKTVIMGKGDVIVVEQFSETNVLGNSRLARVSEVLPDGIRVNYEARNGEVGSSELTVRQDTHGGKSGWADSSLEDDDGWIKIRKASRMDRLGFVLRRGKWSLGN